MDACVEDVAEYSLPDDPTILVRVKSVSVHRMKQYQEAAAKGGNIQRKAQAELIADSVIDENGKPVFSATKLYETMGRVRTRRFIGLVNIVSKHNGGDDEVREAEEAEKKSED